jgi:hypothetical protein
MFHQSERSSNGGDSSNPALNPSSLVWNHSIHTRDFDRLGFKYSVISSVGTAGLNNVLAMLPGRDPEVYAKFPQADKEFIKRHSARFWTEICAGFDRLTCSIQAYSLERV